MFNFLNKRVYSKNILLCWSFSHCFPPHKKLRLLDSCIYFLCNILMCVCIRLFFATPWTVAHQVPLSTRFPRQGYWGGLPFSSPGDLPDPGIDLVSLALQADSSPLGHLGSPFYDIDLAKNSFVTAYRKAQMNFLANPIHKFIVVQSQVVSDSCQPPWTAARQASLSLTISWSLPKFAHKQMLICKWSIPLSTPLFFHKW